MHDDPIKKKKKNYSTCLACGTLYPDLRTCLPILGPTYIGKVETFVYGGPCHPHLGP